MFEIVNFTRYKIPSKRYLDKILKVAINECQMSAQNLLISLAFVGLKRMARLNYRYKGKKKPTDVLSFRYHEKQKVEGITEKFRKRVSLVQDRQKNKIFEYFGEIVICVPYAEKSAKEKNYSLKKELTNLFIHGILHLCGLNHKRSKKEALKMEQLENKILKKFF